MPHDPSALHFNRESTRHFLYSKAEADELPKKQGPTPAGIQAAVQAVYPALLTGHSFLEHSAQQLSTAMGMKSPILIRQDPTQPLPIRQLRKQSMNYAQSMLASGACLTQAFIVSSLEKKKHPSA
jgi:hypothetical protein